MRWRELEMPQGLRLEVCVVDNFGGDQIRAVVDAWARKHPTLSS